MKKPLFYVIPVGSTLLEQFPVYAEDIEQRAPQPQRPTAPAAIAPVPAPAARAPAAPTYSAEFEQRLHEVAFHESGHAVVAEHLSGLAATIELWREAGSLVSGRCTHHVAAPLEAARLVALAGAVAEIQADSRYRGNSGDALLNPTVARISAGDAAQAGYYTRTDLDACLTLVHRLWPSIEARAQREISAFKQREAAGVAAYA